MSSKIDVTFNIKKRATHYTAANTRLYHFIYVICVPLIAITYNRGSYERRFELNNPVDVIELLYNVCYRWA